MTRWNMAFRLQALRNTLVRQGTCKVHPTADQVSEAATMASEVSKLIDDELQKDGRDETSRLLPGQGVKVRLAPVASNAPARCSVLTKLLSLRADCGRTVPGARGSVQCLSYSGVLTHATPAAAASHASHRLRFCLSSGITGQNRSRAIVCPRPDDVHVVSSCHKRWQLALDQCLQQLAPASTRVARSSVCLAARF